MYLQSRFVNIINKTDQSVSIHEPLELYLDYFGSFSEIKTLISNLSLVECYFKYHFFI